MAAISDTVQPGDVISSDLMARIIALLNAHDAALGSAGSILVPNLFGRSIADARVVLQMRQLTLGNVLDALGTVVNPTASSAASLLVLGQVPAAGLRTNAGAPISLLVSGQGTGQLPTTPQITEIVPTTPRVGQTIEIRGSSLSDVNVAFIARRANGEEAGPPVAGVVLPPISATRLFVAVPQGIPGAPRNAGDRSPDVRVRVTNGAGASAEGGITLAPPLERRLTIAGIDPASVVIGGQVRISGEGFSGVDVVSFRASRLDADVDVVPIQVSDTSIVLNVPFLRIPGLSFSGGSADVNVHVRRGTDNVSSNTVVLTVRGFLEDL